MKPPGKQGIVNIGVNALAREVGLSNASISKRLQRGQSANDIRRELASRKGIPPTKGQRGQGRTPGTKSEYDLIIQGRERLDEMNGWKLRRAKALAERQEIENMLRRGELLPLSYARQWLTRFLVDGRDELLKGPSELADRLAAEDDPQKVYAILRTWAERTCSKVEQCERLWEGPSEGAEVA